MDSVLGNEQEMVMHSLGSCLSPLCLLIVHQVRAGFMNSMIKAVDLGGPEL